VKRCGKMIRKRGMPKARPCCKKSGHFGNHTPDLTGLKNIYGYKEALSRGPDYISYYIRKEKTYSCRATRWWMLDRFGFKRLVMASHIFYRGSRGLSTVAPRGSGLGSRTKRGGFRPEWRSVSGHLQAILNKNHLKYPYYRKVIVFNGWKPYKKAIRTAVFWVLENLGPRPSPDHQLHILKTKKHPFGFFGPGGLKWVHGSDRHDNDVLDLVAEWPSKKWREFVKQENLRRESA